MPPPARMDAFWHRRCRVLGLRYSTAVNFMQRVLLRLLDMMRNALNALFTVHDHLIKQQRIIRRFSPPPRDLAWMMGPPTSLTGS